MKLQEFDYALDDDDTVVCHGKYTINKIHIAIDACTQAGSKDGISSKPNEDSFSIKKTSSSILAAVFDGCSSQKPIADLKDQTGARFASHFLKKVLENADTTDPSKLTRLLNEKLLARSMEFSGASLEDVHTLPSSTATIVELNTSENKLNLSHIGDTFCLIQFRDNHREIVTVDRNKKYDDEVYKLIQTLATQNHSTPRIAKQDERVKLAILSNFQQTHNKPDGTGQGIMNGDPNALTYMQDVSFALSDIKEILLGSDGLIPPGWDEQNKEDREKMFSLIKEKGVKGLMQTKKQIEDDDADWNFVRYKHSDDATGIYISL